MYPIKITSPKDKKELFHLSQFLIKQPQFYPDFDRWVNDKCIPTIKKGKYQAIMVVSNKNKVIGDVIYQQLNKKTIEIKNLRIDPFYRNRDLGHFLLKQVEFEIKNKDIILDITVDNFAGVEFFIRNGFSIIKKAKLYLPDQDEFIMKKVRS